MRKVATLLMVLAFAGSTMGAESCSESLEGLEDVAGENDGKYSGKIQQLSLGMSASEVRSIMGGAPRDIQRSESEYGVSEYWYYGSFQLHFEDGNLEGKSDF